MYWGYTMFWAGLAIWIGSIGLLAEALVLGTLFIAWALAVEQPRLRRRYGPACEEYRRHTPMVLPVWKALYYDLRELPNTMLILTMLGSALCRQLWHVRAEGEEFIPRKGPVMVVCNHVNLADPLLLGMHFTRRIHFVASDELFRHSVTRWLFRVFGAMPKRRWSRDIASIRSILRRLDSGDAVGIFPEGQRNWDGGPVIVGDEVYRLLHRLDVPILCATLVGGHEAWPRWSRLPGMSDVVVRFFEPIYPGQFPSVQEFRNAVEERIFGFAREAPAPRRALALHRGITSVLWGCIHCGGAMTLRETREGLECSKCGASWIVTPALELEPRQPLGPAGAGAGVACGGQMRMLPREYHAALVEHLYEGRMDGALEGDFGIECSAAGYRIESTRRLRPLGKGTLRLSRAALVFEAESGGEQVEYGERMAPLSIPLDGIDFTYLNLADHLVVVGPHGAMQFKVEGDSPVRWEDYVSAARGATIRQWKVREVGRSKGKHLKASGAGPDVSHWRREDEFS
jgi:1-acyl-sn-glycerol-3-phosphate acyltransferase